MRRVLGDLLSIAGVFIAGIAVLLIVFAAIFYALGWDRLELGPVD